MSENQMTEAKGNAVTTAKPHTIRGWLQSDAFRQEIAKAAPRHCNPDRMLRVAITALTRTPKLAECEQASFMRCMLDLAQWGLEADGRHAHLIPFRDNKRNVMECQLILDYKGLVQLVYRSGKVRSVHADVVREGDAFEYSLGRVRRHTPWFLLPPGERSAEAGEIYAAYAHIELADCDPKSEVMSVDEINKVRNRSRAKSKGPWVTDYEEMAKKTVFRRATKWLPISAEVVEAFDRDYDTPDFRPRSEPIRTIAPTLDELAAKPPTPALTVEPEPAEPTPQPAEATESDTFVEFMSRIETATNDDELGDIVKEVAEDSTINETQYNVLFAAASQREDELQEKAAK